MLDVTNIIFLYRFGIICVSTLLVLTIISVLIKQKIKDSKRASKIHKTLMTIWYIGLVIGLVYVIYYYRGNLLQQILYIVFGVLVTIGLRHTQKISKSKK